MCNPLAVGAIMMGAGTVANMHGQKKAEEARKGVMRRANERQEASKIQGESAFEKNRQALEFDEVANRMATNTAGREAAYAAANAAAPRATELASGGSMGGNKVISANLGEVLRGVAQRVNETGSARAQLAGFGDAMNETALITNRGREDISRIANFAQGDMRPLELELMGAAKRGGTARSLGSILTTVGGAVMGGAGAAAGAAGAAKGGASMVPYMASANMARGSLMGPWGSGLNYAAPTNPYGP